MLWRRGPPTARLPLAMSEQQQPREIPVRKLAEAGPRAANFMAASMRRGMPFRRPKFPSIPTRPTSPAMMAGALADEVLLATMSNERLVPTE